MQDGSPKSHPKHKELSCTMLETVQLRNPDDTLGEIRSWRGLVEERQPMVRQSVPLTQPDRLPASKRPSRPKPEPQKGSHSESDHRKQKHPKLTRKCTMAAERRARTLVCRCQVSRGRVGSFPSAKTPKPKKLMWKSTFFFPRTLCGKVLFFFHRSSE